MSFCLHFIQFSCPTSSATIWNAKSCGIKIKFSSYVDVITSWKRRGNENITKEIAAYSKGEKKEKRNGG
jgi:hypothetical protein